MGFSVKEINLFMKKYIKTIVIGTVLITLLFTGALFLLNRYTSTPNAVNEDNKMEETSPAYFRFYMQLPDGYSFQNDTLMDEVINNELSYDRLNQEVEFDVQTYIDELAADNSQMDVEESKLIKIAINPKSYVMTVSADLGSPEANMDVVSFYYNELLNGGFEIFERNTFHTLSMPTLFDETQRSSSEDISDLQSEYLASNRLELFDIIVIVMFSILVMFILTLLKERFSKTLNFSFGYNVDSHYKTMVFDQGRNPVEMVNYFIAFPKNNKILLTESGLPKEVSQTFTTDQLQVEHVHSMAEMGMTTDSDEVILFVRAGETGRDWFKTQMDYLHAIQQPVKIIHFINDTKK